MAAPAVAAAVSGHAAGRTGKRKTRPDSARTRHGGSPAERPNIPLQPSRTAAAIYQEPFLIILGVILLIIGFVAKVAIIWTIGIIVVVVGAILALLGMAGHAVGGRRHYF